MHVGDTVAPHVIHAHVEQVCAITGLFASDVDAVVPPLLEHGVTKSLRAVRIGALTNGEKCVVLVETHVLVQARDTGVVFELASRWCGASEPVDDRLHVLWGGSAASTNQLQPKFADKLLVSRGEFTRGQRITCTVGSEHRQSSVRHAHDRHTTELR